jgi:hypothetical protein
MSKKEIGGENFDLLLGSYDALVKSGSNSLQAAYAFGQVCDALTRVYTVKSLAEAISRSSATVYQYLRLYRAYPTERALLDKAEELGTYDVSRLNGQTPAAPVHWVFHCLNCGSFDVAKEKEIPGEAPPQHEHAVPVPVFRA